MLYCTSDARHHRVIIWYHSPFTIYHSSTAWGTTVQLDGVIAQLQARKQSAKVMDTLDILHFILHTSYIVVMLSGNLLTIMVLYMNQHWQTPSGFLIVNLAITDALVAGFLLPFGLRALLVGYWDMGRALCLLNGFTNQVLSTVAVLTLAIITMDRYIAIIHCIRYAQIMTLRRIIIIMGAVWIFGLLTGCLPLAGWGRYIYAPGAVLCVTDFKTNKAFTLCIFTIVFGIPINAIYFIYIKIFRAVRRQLRAIRSTSVVVGSQGNTKSVRRLRKESKAALTMFIIMGCFTICMTPYAIFNLYCLHTGSTSDLGDFLTSKAAYINGALNPLIYGLMNQAFRRSYQRLLGSLFKCRKIRVGNMDDETTHNSVEATVNKTTNQ